MVERVEKKSGDVEDFDRQKIITSCMGAGLKRDEAGYVATEVENCLECEEVSSEKIRDIVLEELEDIGQFYVDNWMEYEREK